METHLTEQFSGQTSKRSLYNYSSFFLQNAVDKFSPLQGGKIPLIVDVCRSDASQIWLPVLLGYKAIYLLIGLLLASQTYNVKIKALRDSRLIVVCVFAIFVISVVLTVVGFFVDDDPDALYGLLACFILTLITGVLGLLFVPRVRKQAVKLPYIQRSI